MTREQRGKVTRAELDEQHANVAEEIAFLLSYGKTVERIGRDLKIKPDTVEQIIRRRGLKV